jgi:HSP20 family protein
MSLLPFSKESQLSLGELQEQMNLLFNRLWHGGLSTGPFDGQDWAPALDVREEPERYVVHAEVPGLKVEDIELTYVGTTLTLKGEKICETATESKTGCLCRERRFGGFSRSITLPEKIEADKITATCRNGVLEVVLPKVEEFKPKPIKIEVEE